MYGCENGTIKKAEHQKIDAFELWCWRRLLRVPWTARRSNQSILKEISPEYSLEGLMLKLKLQYFGHLIWRGDSRENTLMLGKIYSSRRRRQQDEMVRWHHQLNGHEFEQIPGDSERQGRLMCCSPSRHKESDTTEWQWMFDRIHLWNHLVNFHLLGDCFFFKSVSISPTCDWSVHIFYFFSLGRLYLSRTFPYLQGCPFIGIFVCSDLMILCISVVSIVTSFNS